MKATSIGSSLAAFAVFTLAVIAQKQQSNTGWTDYLGGPDGSHYSPL